jgi:hypothetical protein
MVKPSNHDSIADEEAFRIEGEHRFIWNRQVVCLVTKPVKKQSLVMRIIKWLRRS